MFGVTPEGFARPSVQELKSQFETDQLAEISPTLDVSSDSVLGQLNGIYARHLGIAWEALETAYNGFDPDRAEEALLTALAKLTGTDRRGATPSEVDCNVVLDAGTTLIAGTHLANVTGKPDVTFTPKESFTALATGTDTVRFVSEAMGPVQALAGTLTVIKTPVVGWSSVTNPISATPGREVDADTELRLRREAQLTRGGSSTVAAIRADLLEVDAIESVLMFENNGDLPDANGLPPHSFEAVIFDGDPAVVVDDVIAQLIFDNKPAGIYSHGNDSGTAVDENGEAHEVRFSRVVVRNVWLDFTVSTTLGFFAPTFMAAVAASLNEALGIGNDVFASRVSAAAFAPGLGVQNVTDLDMGFAPAPALGADLATGIRELARFDISRMTVTVV